MGKTCGAKALNVFFLYGESNKFYSIIIIGARDFWFLK